MNSLEKLHELARSDEIYRLWEQCYMDSADAFAEFADRQSEDVKNLLWMYAESGRLMYQRKVNLACEHMEFKKGEPL